MSVLSLSPVERQVLALLAIAARVGARCPSISEICDAIGLMHSSGATDAIGSLARKGVIAVERGVNCRRVTIVADGGRTAFERRRGASPTNDSEGYRGPVPEAQRVERDACWSCGTRGDIGCAHLRRRAA